MKPVLSSPLKPVLSPSKEGSYGFPVKRLGG